MRVNWLSGGYWSIASPLQSGQYTQLLISTQCGTCDPPHHAVCVLQIQIKHQTTSPLLQSLSQNMTRLSFFLFRTSWRDSVHVSSFFCRLKNYKTKIKPIWREATVQYRERSVINRISRQLSCLHSLSELYVREYFHIYQNQMEHLLC